ncbi:sensor domain-containing protein [Dactylosporangium sp. CA-092794]|uniref:sensor domain-containing protein n=1 Tax=Dactylosporangium sp. CA-092794 TaxID=3239929 RepID=UPI003D8B0277
MPLLLFPPLLLLVGIPIGALERHRLGFMEPPAVPDPHAPASPSGWAWVRRRVTEAATWRELGYCACLLSVLALLDLAAAAHRGDTTRQRPERGGPRAVAVRGHRVRR